MSTLLSIVIATHNGATTLPAVLEGYQRQTRKPADWELIIVNNCSTDETAQVLVSYQTLLPLKVFAHETPGKNRALNLGLSIATGDLLIFSDDDAIPSPDWLDHIATLASRKPDYDIFGGRIDPKWPSQPPSWLKNVDIGAVYVVTPDDAATGPAPNGANIWGPNMAVRRRVFETGATFDENIGPSSDDPQYRMGSETEFIERMISAGCACWYSDDWRVEHMIHAAQFDKAWVLKRAYRSGRGTYRTNETTPTRLGRTPRWMTRRLFLTYLEYWKEILLMRPDARFGVLYRLHFLKGLIFEAQAEHLDELHAD
jgi:glycosyltransferase involved in cell wall biosynthesis